MNMYKWLKKRVSNKTPPVSIVLMYHRIGISPIDPWALSVTPDLFEEQLQVLKETGLVVPVSQMLEQFYAEGKPIPSVAITFDDGYEDNYSHAKPLLEKYDLPATFFVCTGYLGKPKEFWWDELAHLILFTQKLPPLLSLSINRTPFTFNLHSEHILTKEIKDEHRFWNGYRKPLTLRSQLYMKLWHLLSPIPSWEQEILLSEIREWAGKERQSLNKIHVMSQNQLCLMAKTKLFSIGAHTVSHPLLPGQSKEIQYEEISQSKQILQSLTHQNIDLFAYPSGKYNDCTIQILTQLKFKAAFTTVKKPIQYKEDPYRLGRFQVNNWTGAEFKKSLSHWL